ncbi:glycosyltransferase family 9 protein [Fluviicola sp.]|uniref:glycosyltransferase family 9 protein n=1 Tax=Fluviicola sp. TaxID=1917219 RepID=UPI0031DCD8DF
MKTRTVIALDRLIGIFVAYPLNLLVQLVGKITRFDHSLDKEMQKIVVCKFKGMGSIIQATPLLKTLRNRYPQAQIIFVSSEENRSILEKIDLIDDLYCVKDKGFLTLISSTTKLVVKLMRFRADVYIDLEIYSNYSSIVTTVSLARNRFGYYLRSNRYRMGMYTHMMYFNTKAPISHAYLQFARLLGISEMKTGLHSIPENTVFQLSDLPAEYLVINPNASDLRYERRWSAESFTELIQRIRQAQPELPVFVIGSKNEQSYVHEVTKHFTSDELVRDLSGKTNLGELIEVLRGAKLLITNDTGPMHLASSLDTQVLALFGPCSPAQYGFGKNVKTIYKNVYCSPCVHEFVVPPCKGNNQCMQLITVNEVFEAYIQYKDVVFDSSIEYLGNDREALGKVLR